jgi:hypothetical protein
MSVFHLDSASALSHRGLINTEQGLCLGLDVVEPPSLSIKVVKGRMCALAKILNLGHVCHHDAGHLRRARRNAARLRL